jgi:hypothetical protein
MSFRLASTTVTLTDSRGIEQDVRLLLVSLGQINFVMPDSRLTGRPNIRVGCGGNSRSG